MSEWRFLSSQTKLTRRPRGWTLEHGLMATAPVSRCAEREPAGARARRLASARLADFGVALSPPPSSPTSRPSELNRAVTW